jgi:hypothetical protein
MAAAGAGGSAAQALIPLWQVRPASATKAGRTVNAGQVGDNVRSPGGGKPTAGGRRTLPSKAEFFTKDAAASSFIDLPQEDRDAFLKVAVAAGLVSPDASGQVSPADLFRAWTVATDAAADYNADRDPEKWLSPWEAAHKLALSSMAGQGGAYDPFKPVTTTDSRTTKKDFTSGDNAEQVTRALESIFNEEMGRAPTEQERAIYQKAIQRAYDANPEVTNTTTTTDRGGNQTTMQTQTGGVDTVGTLLDQIRDTPEADSYQAGATYFQAAMQALGAIA